MQISLEETSNLGRKLTVELPPEEVDTKVEKKLQEVAKTARIDGFRPGKVPKRVIKTRYGEAIRAEVIGDVMRDSLQKAFTEKEIAPAGMPNVEIKDDAEGTPLTYEASFEVFPKVELADYSGVSIEKKVSDINDADIDEVIESLQKQHTSYEDADKAAADGDQVIIDFVGEIDGEVFEGGSADNVPLVLGSNSMIPGFEEGLKGVKAGTDVELKVTFPEDYHAENLKGKPAIFKTKVQSVKEAKLPEVAELAEKLALESVDKLREEVKNNLTREVDSKLRSDLKHQVMDKLLELNEVELPEALVKQETQHLQMQALERLKQQLGQFQQTQDLSHLPNFENESFAEDAKKRVALGLLLSEVREKFEIKLDEDRVKAKVEEIAGLFDQSEQMIANMMADQNRMAEIQEVVLEEQLVDKLLDMATVSEKQVSYKEAMGNEEA